MTKKFLALAALPVLVFGLAACDQGNDPTELPPGQYESQTSREDAAGTDHSQTRTTDVYVDENGEKKARVTTETSTDPEGLLNEETTTTTRTVTE